MVELKASQANTFVKQPDAKYNAVLVFGPDVGMVSERSRLIAEHMVKKFDGAAEVIRIDEEDLSRDPDRLAVELQTTSMFGDRNIIRIRSSNRLDVDLIADLLKSGEFANSIIIEAGDLKRGAKLRKVFEGSKSGISIPCYADAERDLAQLIDDELSGSGLRLSRDVKQHIIGLIGSDRALSRSEIQKLAIYMGEETEVTIEDVDAVMGDTSALAQDTIVTATLDGNWGKALGQFERSLAAGQPAFLTLNSLNRYLMRLYTVAGEVENGLSSTLAIKKLRPPVHFKQADSFRRHCRDWPSPRLARALALVQETTKHTRTLADLETTVVERLILALSRLRA